MSDKIITAAVIGCGNRGNAYADCCALMPDKIKIVACADILPDRVNRYAEKCGIPENMRFSSGAELLAQEKLADVCIITTLDRLHYCHAIPALERGYHLLLEKPASPDPKECLEIARVANEKNLHVVVCHVLRYTSFYRRLKQVLDSGKIGKLMSIRACEQACYWHQAHSFVRGNWRNKEETSPMLLQKCCHDMDIYFWLTGKHYVAVSSFGMLSYYKEENAPEGAPERCSEACPAYEKCPYSIKACYLDHIDRGEFGWPYDVVYPECDPVAYREELKTSPFGRCVYKCDNNVVDHQIVNFLMEDDVTFSFTMTAFTSGGGRSLHFMGTEGDIKADMDGSYFYVTRFGEETEKVETYSEIDQYGHGGGDYGLVKDLVALLNGEAKDISFSTIDDSIESHIACLAAEESREAGGKLVTIKDYIKNM